ncbi:MAG: DUF4330 domain-containing protein [Ruminococcaceae bacterium]|nr:DUF4330 domain-containing protein [Oscillospiraceae bacterium]
MKKLIDENGRLFGLISIIDVAVIAVVAVLAVALYTKDTAMPIASAADPLQTVRYEVSITNMPEGRLDSIRVEDNIYDRETGNPMGVIKDVQVEDCEISMLKVDGTYVMAPIEGRYNVTLTVEAEALLDERGHYYINRSNIVGVGWSMDFYTKTSLFGGTITEMK